VLCSGAEGFDPLTPCMPLMCGWFTSPCATSPTHATEQVKGAAEGWVVGRREVTCSEVSGKFLARGLLRESSLARIPAPSCRQLLTTCDRHCARAHAVNAKILRDADNAGRSTGGEEGGGDV
jgi:hypothetical protein